MLSITWHKPERRPLRLELRRSFEIQFFENLVDPCFRFIFWKYAKHNGIPLFETRSQATRVNQALALARFAVILEPHILAKAAYF
jgi:hypothetical protein